MSARVFASTPAFSSICPVSTSSDSCESREDSHVCPSHGDAGSERARLEQEEAVGQAPGCFRESCRSVSAGSRGSPPWRSQCDVRLRHDPRLVVGAIATKMSNVQKTPAKRARRAKGSRNDDCTQEVGGLFMANHVSSATRRVKRAALVSKVRRRRVRRTVKRAAVRRGMKRAAARRVVRRAAARRAVKRAVVRRVVRRAVGRRAVNRAVARRAVRRAAGRRALKKAAARKLAAAEIRRMALEFR